MQNVGSFSDINAKFGNNSKSILLLYKSGHRESECAYKNLEQAMRNMDSISAFTADVNTVLDIHPHYGVVNVPSLLVFEKGNFKEAVKGCHSNEEYFSLVDSIYQHENTTISSQKSLNVTVYSTPTCSWCTAVKRWLQENKVGYLDVDITRNEKAALHIMKRSGHQGVPQIDVNGQLVVGFNLTKLKELLEIQ